MTELKRSIMLKCLPELDLDLNRLFDLYGTLVNITLSNIDSIVNEFVKIKSSIKNKCFCCNETKALSYANSEGNKICSFCFMKQWSEFTMFKKFKPRLMELSDNKGIKLMHSGYYYGAISTAVKIYKSYYSKHLKREDEIFRAKEQYLVTEGKLTSLEFDIKKTKSDIKLGKHLTKELAKQEDQKQKLLKDSKQYRKRSERKHISLPLFRNNEIYFGKQGMFEFQYTPKSYILLLSDYKTPRNKMIMKLDIGNLKKIHKVCKGEVIMKSNMFYCKSCKMTVPKSECKINHQEYFILRCMDKSEHKIIYPKIIKRNNEFFFIFPARDVTDSKTKQEIEDWIKKDKNIEYCSLSFAIKKPVTLTIIKNNKVQLIKTFGNGFLYQRGEIDRKIRSDIFNGISERYRHNHPHDIDDKRKHWKKRNALQKATNKMGFRHQRYCNYYNQVLSHDVIKFIKENCKKPLILFRDTKNIKDISYKGDLMRTLTRWSIQQQAGFIEYKAYLNSISVYKISYGDLKSLNCWKCHGESKEKLTTELLKHNHLFHCDKCNVENDINLVVGHNLYKTLIKVATA